MGPGGTSARSRPRPAGRSPQTCRVSPNAATTLPAEVTSLPTPRGRRRVVGPLPGSHRGATATATQTVGTVPQAAFRASSRAAARSTREPPLSSTGGCAPESRTPVVQVLEQRRRVHLVDRSAGDAEREHRPVEVLGSHRHPAAPGTVGLDLRPAADQLPDVVRRRGDARPDGHRRAPPRRCRRGRTPRRPRPAVGGARTALRCPTVRSAGPCGSCASAPRSTS